MARLTSILLCAILCARAAEPAKTSKPNWGDRKEVSFADLQAGFANPPLAYAPFMFWFWDAPLTPENKALKPGTNALRIRVGNLIANNLGVAAEAGLFGPVTLKKKASP